LNEEKNVLINIKKQNLSDNKNVKISKLLEECREIEKIEIAELAVFATIRLMDLL